MEGRKGGVGWKGCNRMKTRSLSVSSFFGATMFARLLFFAMLVVMGFGWKNPRPTDVPTTKYTCITECYKPGSRVFGAIAGKNSCVEGCGNKFLKDGRTCVRHCFHRGENIGDIVTAPDGGVCVNICRDPEEGEWPEVDEDEDVPDEL